MEGVVCINGEISSLETATVPILERGLLYGDGVFEGIRFIKKKILFHQEHLERFYRSAEVVKIALPARELYEKWIRATVAASAMENGYLRVVGTRGAGEMGITPKPHYKPNLYIIATTIQLYSEELYQSGIRVIVAKTKKIPHASFDCSVKSLNYLPNIMALREALDAGAAEALMTDERGIVSEATVENVFGIRGKELFTPSFDTNCLHGVTRGAIIAIARELGFSVTEGHFTPDDFKKADEVFLTGTGAGMVPVSQIDDTTIGSGSIGPKTRELRTTYESRIESFCS